MAAFVWPRAGWYYLTETKAEAICLILINLSCLRHAALRKKEKKKGKASVKHVPLQYIKVHREAMPAIGRTAHSPPSSYGFTGSYTLY